MMLWKLIFAYVNLHDHNHNHQLGVLAQFKVEEEKKITHLASAFLTCLLAGFLSKNWKIATIANDTQSAVNAFPTLYGAESKLSRREYSTVMYSVTIMTPQPLRARRPNTKNCGFS